MYITNTQCLIMMRKYMKTYTGNKTLLIIGIATAITLIIYQLMSAPDRRDNAQKVSDTISALPNGASKAARQLEDRTPADKLKDAVQDTRDDIKKTMNQK
jgi:hypothetical protein